MSITARQLVVQLEGHQIVRGVDFFAPTGTVTAVVGPNGSGKSTLLRALVRAVKLHSGSVEVNGTDLARCSRRRLAQQVAYVGQRSDGDPTLTVAEEVALGDLARRRAFSVGRPEPAERVAQAIAAVDLSHRATAALGTLSGGELQRVALARAMVQGCDHVLLDEPTNHLDPRHRLEVLTLARTLAPTVIVVLHDLDLAARFADQVIVLTDGAVAAAGPPADVLTPTVIDAVYQVRTHVIPPPPELPTSATHFAFSLPTSEGEVHARHH